MSSNSINTKFPNLPISYDYHGQIPFEQPFASISPSDIHIYLDINTYTGKNTCGQSCNHCWFVNYEKVNKKSFSTEEGYAIRKDLEKIGYKVFARYTDSFANKGEFMRIHGPAHNREFRQEMDHKPTQTMVKGDAWTSGRPLLSDDYLDLLELAEESGYGTISMTFHGLIDGDLNIRPESDYPIKGVFAGKNCLQVIDRINTYNDLKKARHLASGKSIDSFSPFRVNIGVTIGRHNHTRENLVRYTQFFNQFGVATVRFNCFLNHGGKFADLELNKSEIEQFYKDLKWIHENLELSFQLGVSEDFGTYGIKEMNFPGHVGLCQAGRQLFTVIPITEKIVSLDDQVQVDKIGEVVACVNIFAPLLGTLIRTTDKKTLTVNYNINFDIHAINEFTKERIQGVYENGCFAREYLAKNPLELTAFSKSVTTKSAKLDSSVENLVGAE